MPKLSLVRTKEQEEILLRRYITFILNNEAMDKTMLVNKLKDRGFTLDSINKAIVDLKKENKIKETQ